jgi:hypothetical protein
LIIKKLLKRQVDDSTQGTFWLILQRQKTDTRHWVTREAPLESIGLRDAPVWTVIVIFLFFFFLFISFNLIVIFYFSFHEFMNICSLSFFLFRPPSVYCHLFDWWNFLSSSAECETVIWVSVLSLKRDVRIIR